MGKKNSVKEWHKHRQRKAWLREEEDRGKNKKKRDGKRKEKTIIEKWRITKTYTYKEGHMKSQAKWENSSNKK